MDSEIRNYLRQITFDQASIRQIQGMLPADAELDRWLEETAAEYAAQEFIVLTVAALMAGRRLDAHHLVLGAKMLDAGDMLGDLAMKFSGDVAGYLLQALQNATFSFRGMSFGLMMVAVLHRERGEEIPSTVGSMCKSIAHASNFDQEPAALPILLGLAAYLPEPAVTDFLRQQFYPADSAATWRLKCDHWRSFPNEIEKMRKRPVSEMVPERATRMVATGKMTVRRSVPKTGRNEPCHCGSGKKYKHCCSDKDRDRLLDSSDVEGVTRTELVTQPQLYITAERLKSMSLTELAALDGLQIPFSLLEAYLNRFISNKGFDHCADVLERRGYSSILETMWDAVIRNAGIYGRSDVSARLIESRRVAGFPDEELHPLDQLIAIEDDPDASWRWIDGEAEVALESNDPNDLSNLAVAVLLSRHRELGILLCRSAAVLQASRADAANVLEYLMRARDGLSLDADVEPISDVIDKLWADDNDFEGNSELRELKELFALKRREASEAKESLERAERDLKRKEQEVTQLTAAKTATPEDAEAMKGLRRKVENLQQQVKEHHSEATSLRRDLHQKEIETEALRERAESAEHNAIKDSEADAEDDLTLPQESEIHQPLRLIEFPNNFDQRLNAVSRDAARAALAALGRLAGGEAAAFVGTKRLKMCPSVTRIKLRDYRLLVCLLPDRIQVIDLILRSELERKVRILATQYD